MRALTSTLCALALAAAACDPPAPAGEQRVEQDADGDGMPDAADCAPTDPAASELSALYVDADGDGKGVGEPVAVCRGVASPAGYSDAGGDCDDTDAAAFDGWFGFADDDRDGVGAGERLELCGGLLPPRPLSLTTGDCAPDDGSRWRELGYLQRDADADGVTVASAGTVCAGASLPAGHAMAASGADCDDGDAERWLAMEGYADVDLDGFGAGAVVSLCTAGELPEGYVAAAGDCAPEDHDAWRSWAYAYRDVDGDLRTVAEAGTLCVGSSPPAGYLTVASGADCDDGDRGRWELRAGYADADCDGVGFGAVAAVCSGGALPEGWTAEGGDCAADDRLAWREWAYTQRDVDGDTRTVPEAGTLCIGATPPAGYGVVATAPDCDDHDATVWASVWGYADGDHDEVGAGTAVELCTDGTLPAGWVASGTDCAPADGGAWRLLSYSLADADGDGYTARVATGTVCAGAALPDPSRASAAGNDCDDADASVYRAIVRYPDHDGDGVGATPRTIFCVAAEEPAGHSRFGWDVDDGDPDVIEDDAEDNLLLVLD